MTYVGAFRLVMRALPILHRWEYVNSMGQRVGRSQDWVRRTCQVCYRHERGKRWM